MKCNLCSKTAYKAIFGVWFCKKDYLITRDYFISPIKAGLPRKIMVDKIIEYCEKAKKNEITINEVMKKFDVTFVTARDYLLELEVIGYIEHLKNGEWEIKNE